MLYYHYIMLSSPCKNMIWEHHKTFRREYCNSIFLSSSINGRLYYCKLLLLSYYDTCAWTPNSFQESYNFKIVLQEMHVFFCGCGRSVRHNWSTKAYNLKPQMLFCGSALLCSNALHYAGLRCGYHLYRGAHAQANYPNAL